MATNLAEIIGSNKRGRAAHIYFDAFSMFSPKFASKFLPDLFKLIDNSEREFSVIVHNSQYLYLKNGVANTSLDEGVRKRDEEVLKLIDSNLNEDSTFYFQVCGDNTLPSFIEFIKVNSKKYDIVFFNDNKKVVLDSIKDLPNVKILSLREYCIENYAPYKKQAKSDSFSPYTYKDQIFVKGFKLYPKIPVRGDVVTVNGTKYTLVEKTGTTGAEASIYKVNDNKVIKVFKPNSVTPDKMRKLYLMCRIKINNNKIAWPEGIAYNSDGNPIGYIMNYHRGTPLVELTNKIHFLGGEQFSKWKRFDLAYAALEIAKVFKELHKHGVLYGDVSDNNFLIDPNNSQNISVVDTDDCTIANFRCKHSTVGFRSPEVASGKEKGSYQSELFSLAIVIFDILMISKDPYSSAVAVGDSEIEALVKGLFPYPKSGKNYASSNTRMNDGSDKLYDHLPDYLRDAFYNTFSSSGKYFSNHRISAEKWVILLEKYVLDLGRIANNVMSEMGNDLNSNEIFPSNYRN